MMPASLARARLGFTRKGLMRGEGGRVVTMEWGRVVMVEGGREVMIEGERVVIMEGLWRPRD